MTATLSQTLHEKYGEAIHFLDRRFAFFVTHVLNIGRPAVDYSIPTAAVVAVGEGSKVKDKAKVRDFTFVFNPEFADKLSVEDFAFLLAHETMHILLDHLNLGKKFKNKSKANVAMDLVINDYLVEAGLTPAPGACLGEAVDPKTGEYLFVGYNCAYATVTQVYDDLTDKMMKNVRPFDDHTWIIDPDSELGKALTKMLEDMEAKGMIPEDLKDIKCDIDGKTRIILAGNGMGGLRKFTENTGVGLKWAKLLQKLDPDSFIDKGGKSLRPSYHKRPRKLAAFPDALLPVPRENERQGLGEKKLIFMALDTSDSIGEKTANYFVNLARSVKFTNVAIEAITFTTVTRKLDLENPSFGSGGTAFSPIEDYIRVHVMPEHRNKYPSAVVVITDGGARFSGSVPEEKYKERWLWLLTPGCSTKQMEQTFFGKADLLSEYEK